MFIQPTIKLALTEFHMQSGNAHQFRVKCRLRGRGGFTLVELLVVLSILALLLSLAMPKYFVSVDRAKEKALKQELGVVRKALDQYVADHGEYPEALNTLVTQRYLDKMPYDPIVESAETWVLTPPELPYTGGVSDLHSSSPLKATDGSLYAEW